MIIYTKMRLNTHVALGIIAILILMSLDSLSVCAKHSDVALSNSFQSKSAQYMILSAPGRHKRGFGDIDTSNRATETGTTSTSTTYPPSPNPDAFTSIITSKTTTTATTATPTNTATAGGNTTVPTNETTTSDGQVILKTLPCFSLFIVIVKHFLF